MTTPLVPADNVGYVVAADVYCYFTEYYGDGTIYGFQHLFLPNGELVRGEGKSKQDLIQLEVVREEEPPRAIPGELVVVPLEAVPEPEPEPAPEPAPVPEEPKGPYVVKITHSDFTVEYKNVLSVCVNDIKGNITFCINNNV
jgi:hypothetical protein